MPESALVAEVDDEDASLERLGFSESELRLRAALGRPNGNICDGYSNFVLVSEKTGICFN